MIAAEDSGPDAEAVLALALEHHQAGRRAEAGALYAQVLAADPAEPTALYLYGLMCFEAGQPDRAEALLERLAEVRPGHAEAHAALASVRYWRRGPAEAVGGYRQALAIDPGHPGARLNLGAALRDLRDFDGAVAAFEDAIARSPDPRPAYLALAGTEVAAGRPARAAEAYRAAVALDPAQADARAGLALALLGAGDAEAALEAADGALGLDAGLADALMARGAALSALRRFDEAAAALERAVERNPQRAAAHLNLGNVYAELDRAAAAAASLQLAVVLDPQLKEAHASLGSVLLRAGETEAAEGACWRALAIDADMIVPHQNLAAIHAERGAAAAARRHRDLAYGRQNLFPVRAVRPAATVLLLTTTASGNVPYKFLLPADRYSRLDWFIEYARPGQAAALPPYDVVFNAIGDADLAGPTDAPTAQLLAVCERPFFNAPAAVARTRRDLIPALLAGVDGVEVPPVVRLSGADLRAGGLSAAAARAGLAAPLLARPLGSHGGKGLARLDDAAALAAYEPGGVEALYLSAYRDFASADGLYRKYRMIFVDRTPYPYHLAIGDDWMVHYESAPMAERPERRAEELRFLADPASVLGEAGMAAVAQIGRRLDLDYGGVDFTVLPGGTLLVFEANATMLVHPEAEDGPFAAKNPYVSVILSAFQAMIERR
jgi:tetratricopeptide (TPR) repeat protein